MIYCVLVFSVFHFTELNSIWHMNGSRKGSRQFTVRNEVFTKIEFELFPNGFPYALFAFIAEKARIRKCRLLKPGTGNESSSRPKLILCRVSVLPFCIPITIHKCKKLRILWALHLGYQNRWCSKPITKSVIDLYDHVDRLTKAMTIWFKQN